MGDRGRPIAGRCSAEAGMLTPEAAIGEISAFDVLFAQDLFERSRRPPRFCFALFQMVESLLGSSQPEGLAV